MVTQIPITPLTTTTPPEPTSTTTTTTTTPRTTTPTTTPPTTTPPTTTTTTTTTTPKPTTTTPTFNIQTTAPTHQSTVIEQTTLHNLTTIAEGTSSTISSTGALPSTPSHIALAIAIPAVTCVIVIVICFVMYRKSVMKKKIEKSLELDSKVTPKNKRVDDFDQRLSTIAKNGQSDAGTLENTKSNSRSKDVGTTGAANVKMQNEMHKQKANGVTKEEEPRYQNFTAISSNAPKQVSDDDKAYIDVSSAPVPKKSPKHPSGKNEVSGADHNPTHSLYENLAGNPSYDNDAIYENAAGTRPGESLYEQPIQSPKQADEIYVDMN